MYMYLEKPLMPKEGALYVHLHVYSYRIHIHLATLWHYLNKVYHNHVESSSDTAINSIWSSLCYVSDIYHRLLRYKNYFIAMVNKNIIPYKYNLPLAGEL